MKKTINPWSQRFYSVMSADKMKEALHQVAPPIMGVRHMSKEGVVQAFDSACKASFYPTTQCVSFALKVVEIMHVHCNSNYKSEKDFLRNVYLNERHIEPINPIIISGLAGVGKSSLLKRIHQILSFKLEVKVDQSHPPFQILGPTLLSVNERKSPQSIIEAMTGSKSIESATRVLYMKGVPGILIDEMQFLATSASANVAISKVLLGLRPLGIPCVVAANYSLMHKLLRRPDEERHRLLSDVFVLDVDEPESECWINSIKQTFSLLPEIIDIDVEEYATKLHQMTAGRMRALIVLLKEGLRLIDHTKQSLVFNDIQRAYKSIGFSIYRNDAELIAYYHVGKTFKGRTDLVCPSEFRSEKPELGKVIRAEVSQQVADLELRSALSTEELANLRQYEKDVITNQSKKAKVVKLPTKNSDDLISNTTKFLEGL